MIRIVLTTAVKLCLIWAVLHAAPADAGLVLAPAGVVNNVLGEDVGWELIHIYNQSGLSSGYTSGVTDFATYIAGAPTHNSWPIANMWTSVAFLTTGDIDFDLGSTYTVEQIALWDDLRSSSWDIRSFTIFTSADSNFATSTNAGTFILADPAGLATARPVQVFDLTDSVGRYLRLRVDSNRGSSSWTALGELALDVNAASTPEPASLTLCGVAGLVPVGSYVRRRRKRSAPA